MFPSNEKNLDVVFHILPLCAPSLPAQAPPILTQLQDNALEAFSKIKSNASSSVLYEVLNFIVCLWRKYPNSLPAAANIKHLAQLIITSLRSKVRSTLYVQGDSKCGYKFVHFLLQSMSDNQLENMVKERVYWQLKTLIVEYEKLSVKGLQYIVRSTLIFVNIGEFSVFFSAQRIHVSFIKILLQYPSDETLQTLIWQLLTVMCKSSRCITKNLHGVCNIKSVWSLLEKEKTCVLPMLKFILCCLRLYPTYNSSFINNKNFVCCLMGMLRKDKPGQKTADELLLILYNILATLCTNCSVHHVATIFNLKIMSCLQDYAREHPDLLLIAACAAMENIFTILSSNGDVGVQSKRNSGLLKVHLAEYSGQNHCRFFMEMMSDSVVNGNPELVKSLYFMFNKILLPFKSASVDSVDKFSTKDFLEFYEDYFIRNTIKFPNLIAPITQTTHSFIQKVNGKALLILYDISFHVSVSELLQKCDTAETHCCTMGLLVCLVKEYYVHLEDIKPLLMTNVLYPLLEEEKVMPSDDHKELMQADDQYRDDFGRIILNLAANKEHSLESFDERCMEKLLEVFENKSSFNLCGNLIYGIGNIVLSGKNIMHLLMDEEFYTYLLITLQVRKRANHCLIRACCQVLRMLTSVHWINERLIEPDCIELLLQLIQMRKVCSGEQCESQKLLISLSFMATTNRSFILTDESIGVIASFINKSSSGEIIKLVLDIFLDSDIGDSLFRKLREIGVIENLKMLIHDSEHNNDVPDLWRKEAILMEELNLHTLSITKNAQIYSSPTCPSDYPTDWPPDLTLDSSTCELCTSSSSLVLLPSVDQEYLKSHTPLAPELNEPALQKLIMLGLDPNKPLFRIGRFYGSTHKQKSYVQYLNFRAHSMTIKQYQQLIDCGWFRYDCRMYRLRFSPSVEHCMWETRVDVDKFDFRKHKSHKKVLRRMPLDRLSVDTRPAHFSKESFDLYNEYNSKKHDQSRASMFSYCEHVVNTPTIRQTINGIEYGTFHQLYRLDGKLVAVGVIDVVPKGLVSVYMWYDTNKDISKFSFGVYSCLKEIELAKSLRCQSPQIQFYYMQCWNSNHSKLMYKSHYEPQEFICPCLSSEWVSSLDGVAQAKSGAADEIDSTSNEAALNYMPILTGDGNTMYVPVKCQEYVPVKCPEYTALRVDKQKYEQSHGQDLDINTIVVCLNHCEYMYLKDLLRNYKMDEDQQEIIESRFSELYAALTPELRSQLVVDMMLC